MTLSILLDEHLSCETAYQLQALGFLVIPARDRGLLGRKDWELMPWCIEHGSTICTWNGPHFELEHRECRARGQDHFGVLVVGRLWTQEEIFWSLRQYLEANPDPALLVNRVVHLLPATEEFIAEWSGSGGS